MSDEHTLLLGEIKGKLDLVIAGQDKTNTRLDSMDSRLRSVETKAAVNGGLAGGIISVTIVLAQEKLKAMLGLGGS